MAELADFTCLTDMAHTLRVTGVPLQSDFDRDESLRQTSKDCGVEGLDATRLLGPVWRDFTVPACVPEESHHKQDDRLATMLAFSGMPGALSAWCGDYRVDKLTTGLLGPHGPELYAHVVAELPYISVIGRAATATCFTAQLHVERPNQPPVLAVAMWDNGRPYTSVDAVRKFWARDYLAVSHRDATQRPEYSEWLVPASVVLPWVCGVAGGTLSILSGASRYDIMRAPDSGGVVMYTEPIEPIVGNLVLAMLPHVQPKTKASPAIPAQRIPGISGYI